MNESSLDKPLNDLDSVVWNKNENGVYELTEEAKNKIGIVIEWMTSNAKTRLNDYGVHLTGSITSNQYTEESDIDLHFYSDEISKDNAEDFTRLFKKTFEEEFKTSHEESEWHIGSHPIEVYFQSNPVQDYMSVGCYDLIKSEWLVGPELMPLDYDPYSDLYNQDMRHVHGVIGDIRNIILECFETAIAIRNSNDEDFKDYEFDHLKSRMTRAAKIFKDAQTYRKVYSSPQTIEQAKMFRDSRKWKIADSSFKLLDKFGYLKILSMLTRQYESFENGEGGDRDQVVNTIIDEIKGNFSNNKYLNEQEKEKFNNIDESFKSKISMLAIIASMLAIPDVTNAEQLEKNLNDIPASELNIKSPKVSEAIVKSSTVGETVYNGLSKSNLINLVANVIYNEAMIDYKNFHDVKSLIAIGNVIDNRAGGDPDRFAQVVTEKSQFYGAKYVTGGIKDRDYVTYYPYGGYKKCWKLCEKYATMLIDRKLPNVIGNRNMIANSKEDNKTDWESWGKYADLKIHTHTFGYQPDQDGFKKYGKKTGDAKKISNGTVKTSTYTVKKGDTVGKIARKNKTTVKNILKKNPSLKNANFIKIGQKLKI